MEETAQKTWKPAVAGILGIVGGVSILGLASIATVAMLFIPFTSSVVSEAMPGIAYRIISGSLYPMLVIMPILFFVAGILSLIGGIYAIQRKKWKLALAGSIAAIFGATLIGILATVFIALAKDEFES